MTTFDDPELVHFSHGARRDLVSAVVDAMLASAVERNGQPRDGADLPLAQIELARAVRYKIAERLETLVAEARSEGATWGSIADITGHSSRGAAAKAYKDVRG